MNIKSMIKRGLMDPKEGIGLIEHPLVDAARAELEKGAPVKKAATKKKASKKDK